MPQPADDREATVPCSVATLGVGGDPERPEMTFGVDGVWLDPPGLVARRLAALIGTKAAHRYIARVALALA
jgi:hypothetical protein